MGTCIVYTRTCTVRVDNVDDGKCGGTAHHSALALLIKRGTIFTEELVFATVPAKT